MGSVAAQDVLEVPVEQRAQAELEVPVPGPIALVGGTLYTMDGSLETLTATVLVRGGRIEAVLPVEPDGSAPALPRDARVIDVSGQFLIPGLIDGAVSHDPDHDALYVSASVTTVRDTGNDVALALTERLAPARERTPGPQLLIAGPILDSSTASSSQALVLTDGPSARTRLGQLLATMDARAEALGLPTELMRPDFLCFHSGLNPDAWRTLIEVAHAADPLLQVWGPGPSGVSRQELLSSGQDGLLGMHSLLPPNKGWHDLAQGELQPGLEAMGRAKMALTPLLGVFARMLQNTGAQGEQALGLGYLSPTYERLWRQEALVWKVQREESQLSSITTRALSTQRRALLELWRADVPLVPGSGSPNPWIPPGAGLVYELQQWVRAGIPPLEVLRMATAGSASQIAPDRGRIAAGRVADLVVLPRDPGRDMNVLLAPSSVVLRGRELDRDTLQAMRSQLLARQTATRARLREPLVVTPPELPEGDVILTGRARKMAYGTRISAERFAVVRTFDGGTTFLSHQVLPGPDGAPANDVFMTQVFRDRSLQSFQVRMDHRVLEGQGILAEGTRVGTTSRMAVRRRDAGGIIDTKTAEDTLTLVDGSDILNALIVGQFAPLGVFYSLGLEGPALQPGVDRWHLQVHPEDLGLHVVTRTGRLAMAIGANGVPVTLQRRVGSGITELEISEIKTFGGPGLVPPQGRVFVAPVEEAMDGEGAPSEGDDG